LDSAQGLAQQGLDTRVPQVVILTQLGEHRTNLSLAKAEATQRGKELGEHVERLGVESVTVFGTIRVAEANAHVGVALNDELAAMPRSVVGSAQGYEVCDVVAPTLGAQLDVVHVEKRCVATTRYPATMLISE